MPDKRIEKAGSVAPSARQRKWEQMDFYALVHFGMNTFSDSEWGSGVESPTLFNPTQLDCRAWAKSFRDAGMKGMVLTAKHYDGFCLWPSAYTDYSVRSAAWQDGQGDVVRQAAEACREFGLQFGISIALWDRHALTYGQGKAYEDYFRNQLTELLTQYGPLFCVRIDDTCGEGKGGRVQSHDLQSYYDLIRKYQPDAVITRCGPDVRYSGNDAGVWRKNEWSVVPSDLLPTAVNTKKSRTMELDLGSRKRIGKAKELIWYPTQMEISIRKDWFYHPNTDYTVKPLSKLMEYYFTAVGGNGALALNVPPMPSGLLADRDSQILESMGTQLDIAFHENLADDSVMTHSCCLDDAHTGQMALDHNPDTFWHSGETQKKPSLILDMGDDYDIDKVVLQEHTPSGQRVEQFTLYGEFGGKWKRLYKGTIIGSKCICLFREVRVQRIMLVIEKTRQFATIQAMETY